MLLLPYKIEIVFKQWPVTNWLLLAATSLVSLAASDELLRSLVLDGWSPAGLFGHLFVHAGILHLLGNMLFLWVFGNAVCGNTHNAVFPFLYVAFGLLAAVTHLVFDGAYAVGASGAINGVVGMALAMYPLNRVSVFWFVLLRAGTFQIPLWGLSLLWFAYDVWGAASGNGNVAYYAHIGGFLAGLLTGALALKSGWVTLTEWDNESLADILFRKRGR